MELPLVERYMASELRTLAHDMDVHEAGALLVEERISGAPVVDDDGRLVGVFSERDYFKLVALGDDGEFPHGPVSRFMSSELSTVSPKADIYYVAGRFLRSGFRRYPVVEDGRLVGQISRRDVLRAMLENRDLLDRWLSRHTAG